MLTTLVYIMAFAASAVKMGDMPAEMPVDKTAPVEGEFEVAQLTIPAAVEEAAVEEAARKQRSVTKGNNGVVRTVHHTGTLRDGSSKDLVVAGVAHVEGGGHELSAVIQKSVSCKWMIAVLPPLFLLGFLMYIRKAAEKAMHDDAKNSWFNSFLRLNLIQQALAVAGPEKEEEELLKWGEEANAELGKSLLSKVEEEEDAGCCPDSEATPGAPLLQPIQEEEEVSDEDDAAASAKLFASLAESLYQDSFDDDDDEVQVLAADAEVPSKVQAAEQVDDTEWNVFQGSADQVQEVKGDEQFV